MFKVPPPAPADLAEVAVPVWTELCIAAIEAKTLRPANLVALRMAVESLTLYRRALSAFMAGALVAKGSRGQLRVTAEGTLTAQWWSRTCAALDSLGLSPKSAGLIDAQDDVPAEPSAYELERLLGRRRPSAGAKGKPS